MKSHINTGIRKVLEFPIVYSLFSKIIGGEKNREIHFKKYFDLSKDSRVLDIGCGPGVLLKYLNEGIEYHGFDMQKEYIEFAKDKFGSRGNFYCAKVDQSFNPEWESTFDAINAHGLLHHLDDDDGIKLLESAFYYLKPNGYLVTVDTVKHDNQSKLTSWIVSKDRGQNIKSPSGYLAFAKSVFKNVNGDLIDNHNRIPYSIFVMKMVK